jgi:subtilisin family serine protease
MGLLASCGGGEGSVQPSTLATVPDISTVSIPFEKSQLEAEYRTGEYADSQIESDILNQYWIYQQNGNIQSIFDAIKKIDGVKILAKESEGGGILIEVSSQEAIAKIKETGLVSDENMWNRRYIGEDVGKSRAFAFLPPNDGSRYDDLGDNWHLEYARISEAWGVMNGQGSGVSVGVIDAGIYKNHSELDKLQGVYTSIQDTHGTAVTGAISAKSNNNKGVTGIAKADVFFTTMERMGIALVH